MIITYGCQCVCKVHKNEPRNKAPCAFLILRDGKKLRVCTHCLVTMQGDEIIAMMFDKHTKMMPFMQYDELGFAVILHKMTCDEVAQYSNN